MPQVSVKPVTKFFVSLVSAAAAVAFVLPQTSLAQSLDSDPSQNFPTQDSTSPFSGSNGSSGFNPLDLIHRANLGSDRDMDEVTAEQQQNLDDAAAQFRAEQRKRMQLQQNLAVPNNPANPVTPDR